RRVGGGVVDPPRRGGPGGEPPGIDEGRIGLPRASPILDQVGDRDGGGRRRRGGRPHSSAPPAAPPPALLGPGGARAEGAPQQQHGKHGAPSVRHEKLLPVGGPPRRASTPGSSRNAGESYAPPPPRVARVNLLPESIQRLIVEEVGLEREATVVRGVGS